jgi:hypothetical protein
VGNYNPILMQVGIQTKKSMSSSEITKPEALAKFQDDRRRHFFFMETISVKWAITTQF